MLGVDFTCFFFEFFPQGPATGGGPESFDIVIGPRTNRDALGEAGAVSGQMTPLSLSLPLRVSVSVLNLAGTFEQPS